MKGDVNMAEKVDANVLLVDDEEQFLDVLKQRLETRGLHVNSVTSGEEAIDRVQDKDFDAIVVDLAMPGIDGIETLKRIKEKALGIFSAVGVLIYVGIAALCMPMGKNFLDYSALAPLVWDPHHVRALGMLGVEIGVGIAVMAVMAIIYVNIVSEGRHDEGL